MPFTAGFLAGYLAYDMIHYHVHHHKPRTRVGRKLRELHMRHHFQDHERGFGVSPPTGTTSSARRRSGASDPDVILKGRVDTEPDRQPDDIEDGEVVDGLPVLPGDAPAPEPLRPAGPPVAARQAAALAATGFVAGAATVAVVAHRRGAERSQAAAQEGRRGGDRGLELLPRRRAPGPPRLSRARRRANVDTGGPTNRNTRLPTQPVFRPNTRQESSRPAAATGRTRRDARAPRRGHPEVAVHACAAGAPTASSGATAAPGCSGCCTATASPCTSPSSRRRPAA